MQLIIIMMVSACQMHSAVYQWIRLTARFMLIGILSPKAPKYFILNVLKRSLILDQLASDSFEEECSVLIITCRAYRKPPTISPGRIYFRKRFLMDLYKGGADIRGGANTWTIFCVSINKQVRHKQVSHKQENKHVLITRFDSHSHSVL
jgi:hypothetical protein